VSAGTCVRVTAKSSQAYVIVGQTVQKRCPRPPTSVWGAFLVHVLHWKKFSLPYRDWIASGMKKRRRSTADKPIIPGG